MLVSMDDQVVIRTARKAHRCACRRFHVMADPPRWYVEKPHLCHGPISPGQTYVEYFGEAGAYESGTRYCLTCAVAQLGDMVGDPKAVPA